MNLGDMRTQVRDIVGELVADFWTDAELNRYLTEANHRFHNEERWPWLVSEGTGQLLAADPDFDLTEGIAFSRHLNFQLTIPGTNSVQTYMPKRVSATKGFELRSLYSTAPNALYPEWFYVTSVSDPGDDGTYIYVARFVPTPTSNVDLDFQYYRSQNDLDADNAVPDLPIEYHKALVHHAAGTAWLKELNMAAKAGEQFALYSAVLDQARAEWQTEPDDTMLVMGGEEPQWARVHSALGYAGDNVAYPYALGQ